MGDATVCTPLRVEQAAVLGVLRGTRVVRTGMGPARTQRRLETLLPATGPVAVLGVAGGVAPYVQPGDVVVADTVTADGVRVSCPTAPLLAGALRRAGLRVHVGAIATTPTVASGDTRAALAAAGVLAVDMESVPVGIAAGERPFAVVRVVTDTAAAPLLRPGIVTRGAAALRVLRRAAPVVAAWAAAAGDRDVVLASPRSFCAGVERAIEIVERALARFGDPVYVRRQIVHNAHVIADLERRGAVFVTELDEVPAGAHVVLAAHGVTPAVRADAVSRGLDVVDATCPLVAKVHTEARRYADRDHTVILIGHADHEEVVGTVGEAPDRIVVVADEAHAATVDVPDPSRVAYLMQTTLAVDEAERVAAAVVARFPAAVAPRSDDICYATSNRQQAVREVARDVDLVLVIGSPNSSNSRRLVEVAQREGAAAYLVDDVGDVDPAWLLGARRVGVTAGASAPAHLVEGLVACLSGLGTTTVTERGAVIEDVRFSLPKEVS